MRVCVVYDCLFPYTVGGGERWYRNVAERMAREGHEVTYLTLRQWDRGVIPELDEAVRVVAVGPRMALYTASGRRRILPPLVFGLGVGNLITFPPLLAREEFGQRSFGTVIGLVGAATQGGVALGPGLMGLLHDLLGSYQTALWCLVALEEVAAVSVLGGRALREEGYSVVLVNSNPATG